MKHTMHTPGSRCFRYMEVEGDTLTLAFKDGTFRSYSNGKRLFATALEIQRSGGSLGRWYNGKLRGTAAIST